MGAYRFERQPEVPGGKNVIEFDSSADRAITSAFGWKEGSVSLDVIHEDETRVDYDVFAREHDNADGSEKPLTRRGVLHTLTKAEIRRRTDQYLQMSPKR